VLPDSNGSEKGPVVEFQMAIGKTWIVVCCQATFYSVG